MLFLKLEMLCCLRPAFINMPLETFMSQIGVAIITTWWCGSCSPKYWLWLQVASIQNLVITCGHAMWRSIGFLFSWVSSSVLPWSWQNINSCSCVCAQSCWTLCDPIDSCLPGSSVHMIFQTRILGGLPFPPPGELPYPGIEPVTPALPGRFFTTSTTWESKNVEPAFNWPRGIFAGQSFVREDTHEPITTQYLLETHWSHE